MQLILRSIPVLGISLLASRSAAASSIILNGGFETGDLTGWTVSHASVNSIVGVSSNSPHSGSFALFFGGRHQGGGDEDGVQCSCVRLYGVRVLRSSRLATGRLAGVPGCGHHA